VVLARCCLRDDFRIFRAERIASAEPADESFRPRRVLLLREYLALLTKT
jgi:predicted DNA-binding transcriptional regulator YafY